MPVIRQAFGTFTAEEKQRCLDDVYAKCKDKRPDLTPEQFAEELAAGKIQIKLPDGQIIEFTE